QNEYRELQLKSRFLTQPAESFELFETMKVKSSVIPLLNKHLNRLKNAADFFLFLFNEEKIKCLIREKILELDPHLKYRLKIKLSKYGKVNIELSGYPMLPDKIKVILSDKKINSEDPFRYFKTTNRKLYDEEYLNYSNQGFFDVIFRNEKGQITEGSRTNIFIKKNNRWYTPPVEAGILNGIYRAYLLKRDKNIIEKNLFEEDFNEAEEIKVTNALRGEVKVNKLYLNRFKFKEY
ncbi:MAG: aminotransferase class IV, partial [Ignavibacteria bacterium]